MINSQSNRDKFTGSALFWIVAALVLTIITGLAAYLIQHQNNLREGRFKNPVMIKWINYFNVDTQKRTHPFTIGAISESAGMNDLLIETQLPYNFLVQENRWSMGGPGKIYLVLNGDVASTGPDLGANGNCVFPLNSKSLKFGTNQLRLDVLIFNPSNIHGWLLAQGPAKEVVSTNHYR